VLLARIILLAAAPSLFWLWIFYRRDRWEPEPKALVFKVFLAGALTSVPAWLLQVFLPGPDHPIYEYLVRVALVEEACKLIPVMVVALRSRQINEPMDGIIYAVAAALGFATVENVLYALWLGPAILVARAFTSTLAHVALSGLVGYQIGRWRMGRSPIHVWIAFFAVVGLHGAYDLLLVSGAGQVSSATVARLTVLLMIPALLGLLFWAIRLADRASPFRRR
jgi:RsiW-degrading membrane proteinase PrsW (M82 family)